MIEELSIFNEFETESSGVIIGILYRICLHQTPSNRIPSALRQTPSDWIHVVLWQTPSDWIHAMFVVCWIYLIVFMDNKNLRFW
jgi:hypothetical protein